VDGREERMKNNRVVESFRERREFLKTQLHQTLKEQQRRREELRRELMTPGGRLASKWFIMREDGTYY
jgi:hypothetical protein